MLTFETHEHDHGAKINCIEGKLEKKRSKNLYKKIPSNETKKLIFLKKAMKKNNSSKFILTC
jgi:hypothetical protein